MDLNDFSSAPIRLMVAGDNVIIPGKSGKFANDNDIANLGPVFAAQDCKAGYDYDNAEAFEYVLHIDENFGKQGAIKIDGLKKYDTVRFAAIFFKEKPADVKHLERSYDSNSLRITLNKGIFTFTLCRAWYDPKCVYVVFEDYDGNVKIFDFSEDDFRLDGKVGRELKELVDSILGLTEANRCRRGIRTLKEEDEGGKAAEPETQPAPKEDAIQQLKDVDNYDAWVDKLEALLDTDYKGMAFKDYLKKHYLDQGIIPKGWAKLGEEKSISITSLRPTQNEVFMEQSLKFPLTNATTADLLLNGKDVKIEPLNNEQPIITFADKYIIDGHHRWSETYCINPNATMLTVNFKAAEGITPTDVLKAMQLSIVAKHGSIEHSSGASTDKNLFTVTEADLKQFVKEKLAGQDEVITVFKKYGKGENADEIANYIWSNVKQLQTNCKPMAGASTRVNMPQTDPETIELAKERFIDITEEIEDSYTLKANGRGREGKVNRPFNKESLFEDDGVSIIEGADNSIPDVHIAKMADVVTEGLTEGVFSKIGNRLARVTGQATRAVKRGADSLKQTVNQTVSDIKASAGKEVNFSSMVLPLALKKAKEAIYEANKQYYQTHLNPDTGEPSVVMSPGDGKDYEFRSAGAVTTNLYYFDLTQTNKKIKSYPIIFIFGSEGSSQEPDKRTFTVKAYYTKNGGGVYDIPCRYKDVTEPKARFNLKEKNIEYFEDKKLLDTATSKSDNNSICNQLIDILVNKTVFDEHDGKIEEFGKLEGCIATKAGLDKLWVDAHNGQTPNKTEPETKEQSAEQSTEQQNSEQTSTTQSNKPAEATKATVKGIFDNMGGKIDSSNFDEFVDKLGIKD